MYILKILLVILILEITTKIGFIFSKRLNKTVLEYQKLEDIFSFIESKMRYSQDNIINIFDEIISQNEDNNYKVLFLNINNDLKENSYSLKDAICNNINKYEHLFSCKLDLLKSLSLELGRSDAEEQIKSIKLIKSRLQILINDSLNKKSKNEKIYKSLGIICGLMIIIVLI